MMMGRGGSGRYNYRDLAGGSMSMDTKVLSFGTLPLMFTGGGEVALASKSELLAARGLTVGSGGSYVSPMNIIREIQIGEKISDLIALGQNRTLSTGVEHAIVKLGPNSIAPGARVLVSGGQHGISFAAGEISTLFGHTHPFVTGASVADYQALRILGQSKQYIFEGFNNTPLIIRP
jgi:hypothetical protein